MSKKVITVTETTCDLCGELFVPENSASEVNKSIIHSITLEVWYGGHKTYEDICLKCNSKLIQVINSIL